MSRLLTALGLLALISYPLLVFFGLNHLPLPALVLLVAALGLLRLFSLKRSPAQTAQWLLAGVLVGLAGYVFLADDPQGFRYYPLIVNAVLAWVFSVSLVKGPPLVERIARATEGDLPPAAVAYTRKVTLVWCAFFIVNGALAFYTAGYTSLEVWTLYNGLLSYLFMGMIFAIEYLVRRAVIKKDNAHPG